MSDCFPGARTALFALATACSVPAAAQTQVDDPAAFAARVRQATMRFRDRNAAIAAGYRLVGPDFPGMGEHWVNIALLLQHVPESARPAILTYVVVDGKPLLVGAGYAMSLGPGDVPPDFPAGQGAWHLHSGTVEDESFLPRGMAGGNPSGRRLAIVHAWVWLENRAGIFARNNWALPYVRAALEPPLTSDPGSALALALASGSFAYLHARFTRSHSELDADIVDRWLTLARSAVERVLGDQTDPQTRDKRLASIWRDLCARLGDDCREPN